MIDLDEIEARWAEKHREWTSEATSDIMALIQYARHLKQDVHFACYDARRDEREMIASWLSAEIYRLPVYQPSYGPKELRARSRALENAAYAVKVREYAPRVEDDDG